MNPGFFLPALTLGFGALLLRPRRGFYAAGADIASAQPLIVPAQVTLEEDHSHELEITEHPIEAGAAVADHAFKRSAIVRIHAMWSDSPSRSAGIISDGLTTEISAGALGAVVSGTIAGVQAITSALSGNAQSQVQAIFDALLALQEQRVPFDILTGKRAYSNMLLRSVVNRTNEKSENSLDITMICQQVIIVETSEVAAVVSDPSRLSDPQSSLPSLNVGNLALGPERYVQDLVTEAQQRVGAALKDVVLSQVTVGDVVPQVGDFGFESTGVFA